MNMNPGNCVFSHADVSKMTLLWLAVSSTFMNQSINQSITILTCVKKRTSSQLSLPHGTV